MRVLEFWRGHANEFLTLLGQHLLLVCASTFVAIALGVPIGILAARRPRIGAPVVWFANVVQTIPSLAMFGFLLPLPLVGGLGARVAIFVLILYALLPIVRTTTAGLRSIDRVLIEAGTAMGMKPGQLMRQVELPLALPSIVAGIRVAAVIGVGTATIAAAVGAGGLGEYIFRGLSMVDSTVILAGAIPSALLALTIDGALTLVERGLRDFSGARVRGLRVAAALMIVIALATAAALAISARTSTDVIRVGSKNFTEQIILGEIVAQTIETRTGRRVERRLNLGGTFICDRAIRSGDIDVYVEYTGTAQTAIFHQPADTDSRRVFDAVKARYAAGGLTLLDSLGFENTFAMLIRGEDARRLGLRTLSQAAAMAPSWLAGFGYEFLQRSDGYPGLTRTYGFHFARPPKAMDLSLIYRALAERQVDLIAGDATSGLIDVYGLTMLEDDRHYFPPYDAAVVARSSVLIAHPEVKDALASLSGRITVADMRRMNRAVDAEHRDAADVAREFVVGRNSQPRASSQ
ncbi:MAG TPA: glycine betaine ABC transporter substrate-binding protein [Vicinamibacterales bacterium]|jgi:osmoprotectant transport system permease protein|nr:glycine betaine ABC transporter substrate-binding protein [Vicinamibacterales bacterium]